MVKGLLSYHSLSSDALEVEAEMLAESEEVVSFVALFLQLFLHDRDQLIEDLRIQTFQDVEVVSDTARYRFLHLV